MNPARHHRAWPSNAAAVAAVAAVAAMVGACTPKAAGSGTTEVVIFAAASLRESFAALAPAFEQAHPGVKLTFNLAGSQELRTQIEQGARADVFASADSKNMDVLAKQGLVAAPVVFARNQPVLVLPRDNPARIVSFADLPRSKRLVIGAPEVPIGGYTVQIIAAAARKYGADFRTRVEASVISRELNVRQVLAKVTLGEADAAIVYRTDAQAGTAAVSTIAIPAELNVVAPYPVAITNRSPHESLARAWVEALLSTQGQRVLMAHGFLPASPSPPPQVSTP
jgi:molybdate transport system substrate-binding protein